MRQPHNTDKRNSSVNIWDNGTIIDSIRLLTFNTKVKRMKGKAVPLIENLLEDFHMPPGMKALLTSCLINVLTIKGTVDQLLRVSPLHHFSPFPRFPPQRRLLSLESFLSEPTVTVLLPVQPEGKVSFKMHLTSLSELAKFLARSIEGGEWFGF